MTLTQDFLTIAELVMTAGSLAAELGFGSTWIDRDRRGHTLCDAVVVKNAIIELCKYQSVG